MTRHIPAFATSAMLAFPVLAAAPIALIGVGPAHAAATASATRTIKGPSVAMRWGPVQVTIVVTGKRITDVRGSAPMERPRSAYINKQVIPLLRSEALQAQSANVDLISGATMTSEAFDASLQAALKTARI